MAEVHAQRQEQEELSPVAQALFERRLRGGTSGIHGSQAIPRGLQRHAASLSFAQERLWFLHQLEPESAAYNRPLGLRLCSLNVAALERALGEILLLEAPTIAEQTQAIAAFLAERVSPASMAGAL